MKNPYALLNYDMETGTSTPDLERVTKFIDEVLEELVTGFKATSTDVEPSDVGYCFYGNLHWGSIGEDRRTGDVNVDALIKVAVDKIVKYSKQPENRSAAIGDTETDECIAYQLDKLLKAKPVMHGGPLLNRK